MTTEDFQNWSIDWNSIVSNGIISVDPSYAKGGYVSNLAPIAAGPTVTPLNVVKPVRIVYKNDAGRYHLTLGDGDTELPLHGQMSVTQIYSYANYSHWEPMEVVKEYEITLKFRVKAYTIKKIETE